MTDDAPAQAEGANGGGPLVVGVDGGGLSGRKIIYEF